MKIEPAIVGGHLPDGTVITITVLSRRAYVDCGSRRVTAQHLGQGEKSDAERVAMAISALAFEINHDAVLEHLEQNKSALGLP